jgi:hypothetical protein
MRCVAWLLVSVGCSPEYGLQEQAPEPLPPALVAEDPAGEPPRDWGCQAGWRGAYYNPPDSVDADTGAQSSRESAFDQSYLAFERNDPSLDLGPSFWPVDQGQPGDPAGFAVVWRGWLRAFEDVDAALVIGASGAADVLLGDDVVWSGEALRFNPVVTEIDVSAGILPVTVRWWSTRTDESGFRLRLVSEAIRVCPPEP